jgi:electron transport complex protein RnfC
MSKLIKFHGGVHPSYNKKRTENLAAEELPLQDSYVVPLSQNIGAMSVPVVERGDEVKKGQMIAEPGGFVSIPIHAPTSGKVKKIDVYPHPSGGNMAAIEIKSDGEDTWAEGIGVQRDYENLDADAIRAAIRNAGIVGMGGAAFPTHVKLSPPKEKPIDTFILNGAECEPYLTADHRIMLERTEEVIEGGLLMASALGVSRIIIGIEENKPDAVEKMRAMADGRFEVVSLHVVYPQGSEKQLIYALTGRSVPAGGLPMDVGVVVQNVGTAAAAYDACSLGIPLIERIITVTGKGINEPKNLKVRVGTLVSALVEYCGGMHEDTAKAIMGGPMMGVGQHSLDVPIVKGTSGMVFLTTDESTLFTSEPCIRCASCIDGCPMNLLPTVISAYSVNSMFDSCEVYNALDCIECGCCSYSCPSHIPLVQNIRRAKAEIMAKRKKAS